MPGSSQVILYQTEDGKTRLETRFTGETAWLSLNQMADLFQRDKSVISKHIRNVFAEGELRAEATVAKLATVQTEGDKRVTWEIEFFNLDVIVSVVPGEITAGDAIPRLGPEAPVEVQLDPSTQPTQGPPSKPVPMIGFSVVRPPEGLGEG